MKKRHLKSSDIERIVKILQQSGEDYVKSQKVLDSTIDHVLRFQSLESWMEQYTRQNNIIASILDADLTVDEAVFRLLVLKENPEFESFINGFIKNIYSLKEGK